MATDNQDPDGTGATALPAASIFHQQELAGELLPYLSEIDGLGLVLKAPLVFMVPYLPALAELINDTYRRKLRALRHAEAEGNRTLMLALHEKPYRLKVFRGLCERMGDRDYWQTLRGLWVETENLHEYQDEWVRLLTAERPSRSRWLMDEADRAVLARLEEQVTIYRGFRRPGRHFAPSWTLSRSTAEWFARRPATAPHCYLASVTVPKRSIIACFGARKEQEIVLDPAALPEPQITTLTGALL